MNNKIAKNLKEQNKFSEKPPFSEKHTNSFYTGNMETVKHSLS